MNRFIVLVFALALLMQGCGSSSGLSAADQAAVKAAFSNMTNTMTTGAHSLRRFHSYDVPTQLCTQNSVGSGDFTATTSCPSPTVLQINFTQTQALTADCGGTSYTISGTSGSVSEDFTNANFSNSSFSGTVVSAFQFNSSVNGKTLSCTANFDLSLSNSVSFSVDCSNFNCTFGGVPVSCSDIQSFNQESCT